jgi:hypothetical protein
LNKGAEQIVTAYNNNFEKLANFMKEECACAVDEFGNRIYCEDCIYDEEESS